MSEDFLDSEFLVQPDSLPLKAPNEIQGVFLTRKCAEKNCNNLLGHWSKTGAWKYPGAKCEKHSKGRKK